MKKIRFYRIFLLIIFLGLGAGSVQLQTLTVKEIMQTPSIAGMRISGERLSPDGKYVVYLWNAEGKDPRDLYLVSTADGTTRKLLSPAELITKKDPDKKKDPLEYGVVINDDFVRARRNQIGNPRWSPDSKKILFTQNGDVFVLAIDGQKPKRITKTESVEFSAQFLDNDRILFQQNGNFYAIDTKNGTLTQISREANRQKRIRLFGATPSRDGAMLAYVASDGKNQRPLFVPNYLPLYTAAPTVRRGWTKPTVYVAKTDGSFEKPIEIKLPKPEGEAYIAGLEWLADNKTLLIDRVDKTHKRRQIFFAAVENANSKVYKIHAEEDSKWIGRISRILEAHPTDPTKFFFASEDKTGYNHLYLIEDLTGEEIKEGETGSAAYLETQLTNGNWEVVWAEWSETSPSEDSQIVFASTKDNPAERKITVIANIPKAISRHDLPLEAGMKNDFQLEDKTLIYEASRWNSPPEFFTTAICHDCENEIKAAKLTTTTPEAFLKRKWNEPVFTEFAARDSKKIPAKIYFPEKFDKSKKYPMVIFVHGAGYLQNVINGWNNYYREFMFNQLLTQQGYVVLDIDYRGSAGYGRDFRTDVYDFLGDKDYTDHLDGIDFMIKEYNIDPARVGVYGGSYGGFMAAMLVMRAPDKIAAAAALRPVMDWKNYYAANPFYTSQRLGDPKKNPEAYKRSSPISYAAELRKPLLILHGLLDDNVHAQDSIQLVEQLIRLDKTEYFDIMVYPAERHSFQRPSSWEDEYERILELFETHLK